MDYIDVGCDVYTPEAHKYLLENLGAHWLDDHHPLGPTIDLDMAKGIVDREARRNSRQDVSVRV